jgi:Holliday junction resolvasome RuvABC endonuclease subunit
MHKTPRTVLALDPGLRELGYAVLAGKKLIASGVRPLFLTPPHGRIAEGRRLLKQWLAAYRPDTVVLERTYPHPTGTFDDVHRFATAMLKVAGRRGFATATYPPQTVRKAIVGNGNAEKREGAKVLAARYPALRMYLSSDKKWKARYFLNAFDAVALAVFHQGQNPPSRSRSSG